MNKKKKIIIGSVVLLAIILLIYFIFIKEKLNDKDKASKMVDKTIITEIKNEDVREIYSNIEAVNCSGFVEWNIDETKKILSVTEMTDNQKLDLIFRLMENEKKLNDEIAYNKYEIALKKMFGEDAKEVTIKDYNYKGYIYNKSGNNITRIIGKCKNKTKYISDLFGYSYNEKNLTIYINVAKLKNNKLYDLNDQLLGDYTEGKNKKLLDKSTTYIYVYQKNKDNYYLTSVEIVPKEVS